MTTIAPIRQPPAWANQNIALYHGTVDTQVPSLLARVDPTKGRKGTDFGIGFYTTTLERQAYAWAWTRSLQAGARPAVIRFDVDRDSLASLDCLWFVRGSYDADDFWSLVLHCRQGRHAHGRTKMGVQNYYDIVIGPLVANWRFHSTYYDSDQVSFHTVKAAGILDAGNKTRVL